MNTSNLENCKRLYELSGWHDTQAYGYGKGNGDYAIQYPTNKETKPGWWWYEGINAWPAYDSGYLLRKLPTHEFNKYDREHYQIWCFDYSDIKVDADTPEDALCLLAIKLFEEGILK